MLLTGGLGYVGGRLAQWLAATSDHELTLASRRPDRARAATPAAGTIALDWASDAGLEQACEGMDAVVHLAGMNAADCGRDPVAALTFNGVATARLVRAAARCKVARFIYLSSAHVYGAALRGCVDERTCPEPHHPYATSHRAGEDAVRSAEGATAMARVVVRLSNAFGAPVHPEADCWSLVANDLCRQAVTTRREVLRSAGNQRRDFVPMSEACRAIAHLLRLPAAHLGDGLFNVGGSWTPTIFEMAQLIATRVAACCRFQPQVVPGSQREESGTDLREYSVAKLVATGFDVRRDAIAEELDRLLAFCLRQSGESST